MAVLYMYKSNDLAVEVVLSGRIKEVYNNSKYVNSGQAFNKLQNLKPILFLYGYINMSLENKSEASFQSLQTHTYKICT